MQRSEITRVFRSSKIDNPSLERRPLHPSPTHPPRIFVRARISLRFNRMDQTNKRQSSLHCILLKFPCRISLCAEIPTYFPLSIDAKNDAFPSLKEILLLSSSLVKKQNRNRRNRFRSYSFIEDCGLQQPRPRRSLAWYKSVSRSVLVSRPILFASQSLEGRKREGGREEHATHASRSRDRWVRQVW